MLTGDGAIIRIRPIVPADADAIRRLHSRLSERTRYLRCFGAYPRIPDTDLARCITVDNDSRVALVAELHGDLLGVARYDRVDPPDDADRRTGEIDAHPIDAAPGGPTDRAAGAEVAFVVEDAHQGHGIGSVLLEHLAAVARERGVLTDADAHRLVRAPRAAPVLVGHRGTVPVAVPVLEGLLQRLSALAEDLAEVLTLDLNPVVVGPSGLAVLHATGRIGPARSRIDPGPRRL